MSTVELQCYNKGCGMKFKEDDNKDDSCVFHPGEPVFHDAMKGWSCCKKRSTDFSMFLSMPGCAKGKHNPVKPLEPEKPKANPLARGEVVEVRAPKPKVPIERPSDDIPFKPLKVIVGGSLKSALTRLKIQEQNAPPPPNGDNQAGNSENIQFGTKCKHNGCDVEYQSNESELSECRYHPGTAIFHEGYKFWTCCQRRTSDFNEFMKQEGCKAGDHLWKDEEGDGKKINCRFDWHQTGSSVVISIYAKCVVPEDTRVEANPTNVSVSLSFEGGKKTYTDLWKLGGVVDPDKSSVELLATKAEIKLRKAEAMAWKTLQYKK